MRKFQIGVMGSMADLDYSREFEQSAERIGELIAEQGGILVFGADTPEAAVDLAFREAQAYRERTTPQKGSDD